MGRRVLIESRIWDSIVDHYAAFERDHAGELSDADREVIRYMVDKIGRQLDRETYELRLREGVQGRSPGTFT